MSKRLVVLFILILFLLAACSGAEQTPVSEAPASKGESEPTTAAPTQTSAPEKAAVRGPQMECTLVSDQPEVPAELEAIFGVTEDDWVKGPDAATVTFVEYSDFQ